MTAKREFKEKRFYHVIANCFDSDEFEAHPRSKKGGWKKKQKKFMMDKKLFCDKFASLLRSARQKFKCQVSAFVVMDTHFHILMYINENNMSRIMQYIMGQMSRYVHVQMGNNDKVWARRYWVKECTSMDHVRAVAYYILNNPVNAYMVNDPAEYAFSSLNPIYAEMADVKPIREMAMDANWVRTKFKKYPYDWLTNFVYEGVATKNKHRRK